MNDMNDMYFEALCEKMGYNPLKDENPYKGILKKHVFNDNLVSPFSVLSIEESEFMTNYLIEHRDEIKL